MTDGAAPRILLVDHDPQVRGAVGRVLTAAGYEVEQMGNGRGALERCRGNAPDVVVLDVCLPEVDYVEALIRLSEAQPGFKVIALSGGGRGGTADPPGIRRALGAVRTLAKPFGREELLAAVSAVCGER